MTKKRGRTYHKTTHTNRRSESHLRASTVGKQKKNSAGAARPTYLRSNKAYDAGRSLVGAAQSSAVTWSRPETRLSAAHRTVNLRCNRCSSCQIWSSGLRPNARWDDVDGPMAHHQPLVLRVWGSPAGTHSGVAPDVGHGMFTAYSGEMRR